MRFQIGELAIYAVARDAAGVPYVGKECTIHAIGPFKIGEKLKHPIEGHTMTVGADGDYIITYRDGRSACPKDWQLRKINPPDEPKSIKRTEETKV